MDIDPLMLLTAQRAELQRAAVEAERHRVAAERREADEARAPLRKAADRAPFRRRFRKTVEN
ncbi:hypothetical protein [Agromyces soli]|uniref:Uncharacterized protein n=1 Tax=Agromyces soli TaxID=659012 RepID=A0ABY4ANL9_9MICO|nr:hypothetical protein [Agromyces soli]UOE24752.1 hypothetical protein MTP13_10255 [Agromyces soli]